jgi:ornithine carbamoyltransferase
MAPGASVATPPRHFFTLADLDNWTAIWERAAHLKRHRAARAGFSSLTGKSIALVFEKASTRTRVSFEVGTFELGGHAIVLTSQGSQLARGEPPADTARVLGGYCHGVVLRTAGQARLEAFATASPIPVINGLTDEHHPCQIATDLFTVLERFGRIAGLRYAWVGDGNNVCASWIEAAGLFGLELAIACPEGHAPDAALVAAARARQASTGGSVTIVRDPREAAAGAHVISTDVWASMGQEDEAAARRVAFQRYLVDGALVAGAAADAIVLHCLPAHRGEEITGEVLDGPRSLAWVQAENRLHVGKALLEAVFAPPL